MTHKTKNHYICIKSSRSKRRTMNQQDTSWAETMIVVDAEYADSVAFDLTVNFERMLERRIPKADMALWLDCVALDGGVREGGNNLQVVLVHERGTDGFNNFTPSRFDELSGKAFKDHLGEFSIMAISSEEIASKQQIITDIVATAVAEKSVKRIIIVPDTTYYDELRHILRNADEDKRITMLAMQPMPGGNFRQEILGYSLMQALGIHADEIEKRG